MKDILFPYNKNPVTGNITNIKIIIGSPSLFMRSKRYFLAVLVSNESGIKYEDIIKKSAIKNALSTDRNHPMILSLISGMFVCCTAQPVLMDT
jgi:hypothetical protein